MGFKEDNEKERLEFVERWAEYVKKHPDKVWSKQQNMIINSCLNSANMTKEQYLKMKKST